MSASPDLCFVVVSTPTAAPPINGHRCGLSLDDLLPIVAEVSGVEADQLRGHGRAPMCVAARWAWWVLLHERGACLSEIGRKVNRDHSSVANGLRRAATCQRTQVLLAACRVAL